MATPLTPLLTHSQLCISQWYIIPQAWVPYLSNSWHGEGRLSGEPGLLLKSHHGQFFLAIWRLVGEKVLSGDGGIVVRTHPPETQKIARDFNNRELSHCSHQLVIINSSHNNWTLKKTCQDTAVWIRIGVEITNCKYCERFIIGCIRFPAL